MKKLYDVIFDKSGTITDNLAKTEKLDCANSDAAKAIIEFMKQDSHRSFCMPKEIK